MTVLRHPASSLLATAMIGLALACAPGEVKAGLGPNESSPIVQIVISPAIATINADEILSLAAGGIREDGSTATVSVVWTTTGGSISSGGVYTPGPVPGTYTITARLANSTLSASAEVTVNAVTSPLVGLHVSPDSTIVYTNQSVAFDATGTRQDGSSVSLVAVWTATGGTVNTSGRYTAGTTAGTFWVIATQQGGSLADTSVVTVVAAPAPGDPYAHRPANYTNTLTDYGFSSVIPSGGDTPVGDGSIWNQVFNDGTLTRQVDPSAPISPSYVLEAHYPPGHEHGTGVGQLYASVNPNIQEFYVSMMVKWDPNYEWNPVSNKLFIFEPGHIIFEPKHYGDYLILEPQDFGTYYTSNVASPVVPLGQWVNLEIQLKRGNNGFVKIWMNGTLYMDRQVPIPSTGGGYQELSLNSTWGGTSAPTTRDSYRWVDHILIATP